MHTMVYLTTLVLTFLYSSLLVEAQEDTNPLLAELESTVQVSEDTPPGTPIYDVQILIDLPLEIILDENDAFELSSDNRIYTVTPLDCETQSSYNLTFSAFLLLSNFTEEATLYVEVLDVNDNNPVFLQSTYIINYFARIDTLSNPNRVVSQVTAEDQDCSFENSRISYSVPDDAFEFSIDANTGEIFAPMGVASGTFIFDVIATDPGRLNGTAMAFLVFTADCGPVPNIANGNIVINGDNITHEGYSASVTCAAGYYTDTSDIECTTNATWEQAICQPIGNNVLLTELESTVQVSEDAPPGTPIYDVQLLVDSAVEITLEENNGVFELLPDNRISTTTSLDCETQSSYNLTFSAFSPSLNIIEEATLYVEVIDVNDNSPVFLQPTYFINYFAGLDTLFDPNRLVLQITAFDQDCSFEYSLISYSVPDSGKHSKTSENRNFVNQQNKYLNTSGCLLYHDSDTGSSCNNIHLFTRPYNIDDAFEFSIDANTGDIFAPMGVASGTFVFDVIATDPGRLNGTALAVLLFTAGPPLLRTVPLVSVIMGFHCVLNKTAITTINAAKVPKDCGPVPNIANGNIVINGDNITHESYLASVTCAAGYYTDTSVIECTTNATWEQAICQPIGNNVLLTELESTVQVSEDAPPGTPIYDVQLLVDSAVEITLEENNGVFELLPDNRISTTTSLDCETQSSYNLTFSAFSPSLEITEEAILYVDVQDVNDNSPVFLQESYRLDYIVRREELEVPNRFVAQVTAVDQDCSFENSQISYSITNSSFNVIIDANTGVIFAPYGITSGWFYFDVTATDPGQLIGTAFTVLRLIADCGPVPNIANGNIVINGDNITYEGYSANVTCAAGYYTATPEIQCTGDALWDALWELAFTEQDICQPIEDCQNLMDPLNGTVSVDGITFESTAVFECDAGFDLEGSEILTCTANGTWDSDPPECLIKDCGSPPPLANGDVTTDTGGTTFGTFAIYQCNDGYDLEGSITSICLFNGTWEQSLPFCRIRDCGELGNQRVRRQAQNDAEPIIDYNSTTVGSIATFTCNPGYTLSGDSTLSCSANGQWSGTVPQCNIKHCGLIAMSNARVSFTSGTTFGSIATFTCHSGYELSGNISLECGADGQWNGTLPTCTSKDCGELLPLANGSVMYTNNVTTVGSNATFTCNPGYTLSNNTVRTCTAAGTWNGTFPTCDINDCGTLGDSRVRRQAQSSNQLIISNDATTYGSIATFACNPGYTLSSSDSLLCSEDGQWNGSIPTCNINDCGTLGDSRVRRQAQSSNQLIISNDATTYGSIATFACNPGYTLSSSDSLFCSEDGQWNGSIPTCNIKDCGNLELPENGVVRFDNDTTYGSSATYICEEGYRLSRDVILNCTAEGRWDGEIPSCVIKDCSELAVLEHGSITYQDDATTVGSKAEFECDTGYSISSDFTLACRLDGTWNGTIPSCIIKDCGTLGDSRVRRQAQSSNQLIISNDATTYGSVATFTCNPGYTLSSSDSLFCSEDGQWNGSIPTCNIIDCGTVGDSRARRQAQSSNQLIISNGATTYGSIATFGCNPGYTLSSSDPLFCSENGQWNGSIPTCNINDCGTLGDSRARRQAQISNQLIISNGATTYGSIATFSCNPGYTLSSSDSLYCSENGQWNGSIPTCNINDCNRVTVGGHLSVTYRNDVTTFGSVATFACSPGYALSGSPAIICTSAGTWNHTVPTCTLKDCGALQAPASGSVTTAQGTSFGATATYRCNEDYRLIGDTTRTCGVSGRWSGFQPSCVRTVIPVTPCPVHVDSRGTQWTQTLPNLVRVAECQQGFTGNATRRCNNVGNWDPPNYNCIREQVRNIEQQVSTLSDASTTAEVEEVVGELLNVTSETTGEEVDATDQLTDAELSSLSESVEGVAEVVSEDQAQAIADNFIRTASNLIDDTNRDTWVALGDSEGVGAERVISAVSAITDKITGNIQATGTGGVVITEKNIAVEVRRVEAGDINFPSAKQIGDDWENSTTRATIPNETFEGRNVTSTGVLFRNMSAITRGNKNSGGNEEINGPVVAMSVRPALPVLDPPITLAFQHSISGLQNPSCTFWNITEERWSTSGCTLVSSNVSVTVCQCNHLTNFAVLMSAFVEADAESTALRIASIAGIGLSIIFLILTLALHFYLWRYLRNDRTTILMHLCVALLLSYIIFLAGVDRTESRVFCAITAVLLQYIYLVVFCVMLANGIEIAITVMFVFVKRSRIRPLLIGAWVIPAIIVAISLGVTKADGYGNDNFCWLSIEGGLIWSFIGPVLAILLFNTVILLIVMKVMFSTKFMAQKKKLKKVKTGLRSLGVLIPLMGVTWIIGIFYINKDFYWIQYVFSICNGLQGFFIFLFHCALNPQIKMARAAQKRRKSSTSLKSTMRTTSKFDSKNTKDGSSQDNSGAYLAKSITEENQEGPDNFYNLSRGSGGNSGKRSPNIALSSGSSRL